MVLTFFVLLGLAQFSISGAYPADNSNDNTVCYGQLGCFSNEPPFDNALGALPSSPDVVDTHFLLYASNGQGPFKLDNATSLNAHSLDFTRETKVIIHGFGNTIEKTVWIGDMRKAFLATGKYNVIEVGWNTQFPNYPRAVADTRVAAKVTQGLINGLMSHGLDLSRVHLIGHSLGAHVAGYVGHLLGSRVARITGLDPAGPYFAKHSTEVRLDPSDAHFVDVIHSNGHELDLIEGGFGLLVPSGHVDFYPNGGEKQPGCVDGIDGGLENLFHNKLKGDSFAMGLACSHGRSHDIFTESISSSCLFTARKCANYEDFIGGKCNECGPKGCNSAGLLASPDKEGGKQYLLTRSQSPLCGQTFMVTIIPDGSANDMEGQLVIGVRGSTVETTLLDEGKIEFGGGVYKRLVVFKNSLNNIKEVSLAYKRAGVLSRRELTIKKIILEPLNGGVRLETNSTPFLLSIIRDAIQDVIPVMN